MHPIFEALDKPIWFPANKIHKGFLAYYKCQEFDIWGCLHLIWFLDKRNNRFIFTDQIDEYIQELMVLEQIAKRRDR